MNTSVPPEPSSLPAPAIPDAVSGGLGYNGLLAPPDRPILVTVGPWDGFQNGDGLELLGPGMELIALAPLSAAGPDGVVRFYVWGKILAAWGDGEHELRVQVVRGGLVVASRSTTVRIRLSKPGTGTDGTSSLTPPTIVPTTIARETASASVTIDAYANMRAGDSITLRWGRAGNEVLHTVSEADVGKPIAIAIDRKLIDEGGSGSAVPVSYRISDDIGNASEWSPSAHVDVADPTFLDPPFILESSLADGVYRVDMDVLGSASATAEIKPLQAGDAITVHLVGTTANDMLFFYTGTEVAASGTFVHDGLPNDLLKQLIGGSGSLWYTRKRAGVETASLRFNFFVAGTPVALGAPTVIEGVGDNLDPDTVADGATLEISAHPFIRPGTRVEYLMHGSSADGTVIAAEGHVDIGPETTFPLRFTVPGNRIAALVGGTATFGYTLLIYDGGPGKTPKTSLASPERTYRIHRATQPVLPAPAVTQADKDTIDPAKVNDRTGVEVKVSYPGMEVGDKVTLHWKGTRQIEAYQDALTYRGTELAFLVDEGKYLAPNLGGTVSIYYTVERVDSAGNASKWQSGTGVFNVSTPPANLLAPVIAQAPDGKLRIDDVDKQILVTLPSALAFLAGDSVYVDFGEYVTPAEPGKAGLAFAIPADVIERYAGQSVPVTYTVTRDGQSYVSETLTILVVAAAPKGTRIDFEGLFPQSLQGGSPVSLAGGAAVLIPSGGNVGQPATIRQPVAGEAWRPFATGQTLQIGSGNVVTFELGGPITRLRFGIVAGSQSSATVSLRGMDGAVVAEPLAAPRTALGGGTLGAKSQTAVGNFGDWFDYRSTVPVKQFRIVNTTSGPIVVDNFELE